MKICHNCGFEMADNMNFCPQCHARFETAARRDNKDSEAKNGGAGERLTKAQRDTLVKRRQEYKVAGVLSTVAAIFLGIVIVLIIGVSLLVGQEKDPTYMIILLAAWAVFALVYRIYLGGKETEIQDKLDADDR